MNDPDDWKDMGEAAELMLFIIFIFVLILCFISYVENNNVPGYAVAIIILLFLK